MVIGNPFKKTQKLGSRVSVRKKARGLTRVWLNRIFVGFRPNKEAVELLHSAGYIDLRNSKINRHKVNFNALLNILLINYMRSPAGPLLHKSPAPMLVKFKARLREFNLERTRIVKRMKERNKLNNLDEKRLSDLVGHIEQISHKRRETACDFPGPATRSYNGNGLQDFQCLLQQ